MRDPPIGQKIVADATNATTTKITRREGEVNYDLSDFRKRIRKTRGAKKASADEPARRNRISVKGKGRPVLYASEYDGRRIFGYTLDNGAYVILKISPAIT